MQIMQNIMSLPVTTITKILEQAQQQKQISRRHYSQIISLMLSIEVGSSDRTQINQILNQLQLGQIRLTN